MINGKQLFKNDSMQLIYGSRPDMAGFLEAIKMMKKGSRATVIIPSRMAFGEKGYKEVPPYSTIIYNIEILDVISQVDVEKKKEKKEKEDQIKKENRKNGESGLLKQYIKDNKITVQPTPSGLYYIEKVKGTGPQIRAGSKVSVQYTGTLLNGKKFDSTRDRGGKPFDFVVGKGNVIKGWEEGFLHMRKGGRATLICPSSIAYGELNMGSIPPYSTLVFDVEVVDVN
jgi:FKBP-type peptidyl-prolyl cis-trans isomerase